MMTARIITEFTDEEGDTYRDIYELETDAGYNPDTSDDLMKRVTTMARMDREAKFEYSSERDEDDTTQES